MCVTIALIKDLIKDAGHPRALQFEIISLILNEPIVEVCFLKKFVS